MKQPAGLLSLLSLTGCHGSLAPSYLSPFLSIKRELIRSFQIPKIALGKDEERESCRSASRSHGRRKNEKQHFPSLAFIEKKNLGDEILITLPQEKM